VTGAVTQATSVRTLSGHRNSLEASSRGNYRHKLPQLPQTASPPGAGVLQGLAWRLRADWRGGEDEQTAVGRWPVKITIAAAKPLLRGRDWAPARRRQAGQGLRWRYNWRADRK
jgi:hypothetical protein